MKEYKSNKKRIAVYIRVANKEFVKEDSSIELQKRLINEYLKSEKEIEYKEYYIDNGFSGTKYNRPSFKKMIKDIKQGKINMIVFTNLSRISRKINAIDIIYKLKDEYGVDFVSIDEGIDTIHDTALLEYLKIFNDMYIEYNKKQKISEKKVRG